MKDRYIRSVRRALVSRKHRQDILRDLNEIFASAAEHGETEQQVIDRLGTPAQFAREMEEQLGIDRRALRLRRLLCTAIPAALLSLIALLYFTISLPFLTNQASMGIIGGADGPTAIFVTTSPADPLTSWLSLLLALLCGIITAYAIVHFLLHRKK